MTHPVRFGIVAASTAVILAACSSGSPHPGPTATAVPTTTASPTPVLTAPTRSPSASVTSPVVTSAHTCAGSQLRIVYSPAGSSGGAGDFVTALAVLNAGAQPCEMRGWPSLQFLGSGGSLLPTHEVQTTSALVSAKPVNVVILPCNPGMSCPPASFNTAYISFAFDDVIQPCETATGIRVLTPGGSTPVVVNLRIAGSFPDGQVICSDGKIEVLPVHS
ncbi:MAG TPA: DUF4232 domain-containing protein [Candidatus Dormibacteraeota bacterium]